MKRFLTVAAALILLMSACGTAPTEPTQSPTPEITSSPPVATDEFVKETGGSSIHMLGLEDLPDYVPELGFEHESVWRAEAFGNNGAGLLYVSGEENGERRVRLYFYDYAPENDDILTTVFDLLAHSDEGKYEFCLSQEEDALRSYFSLLSGTAELNGGKIQLSYSDAALELTENVQLNRLETGTFLTSPDVDRAKYLPMEFVRLSEDEASKAMYEMPLFRDEISLPVPLDCSPDDIKRIFGEVEIYYDPLSNYFSLETSSGSIHGRYKISGTEITNYYVHGVISTANDFAVTVRGIEIGQSLYEVTALFPGRENVPDNLDEALGIILLYGQDYPGMVFGTAYYEEGRIYQLVYALGGGAIKLGIDGNGNLESVRWF